MKPTHTRVRMYQVGFGDCFLLTFRYARAPLKDGRRYRHMLIDFGSTRGRDGGPTLAEVAKQIVQDTGGNLDVLVVSHRHKDHLDGFGDRVAGPLMEGLKPRLVIRPWTDHPGAMDDALRPPSMSDRDRRTAQALLRAQRVAEGIATQGDDDGSALTGSSSYRQIAIAATSQVPNRAALQSLERMAGANGTNAIYAHFGTDVRLDTFIPGVSCDVLGPPTIEMSAAVLKQRDDDPNEFWLGPIESADGLSSDEPTLVSDDEQWDILSQPNGLGSARWLLENLQSHRQSSLLRLVRLVDKAINNTSLILLLTVRTSHRLLFGGDAQIENWQYALDRAKTDASLREKLQIVDLYKVGHHGSRNATPKSLFALWTGADVMHRPMTAMMSTMPGVHGKSMRTAVPRQSLITALEERMTLHRTDELGDALFLDVVAPTSGTNGFRCAALP